MAITISQTAIVAAVERHIRIAKRNEGRECFTAMFSHDKHIAAADAVLALSEAAAGIKVRTGVSIDGLNKRLKSLVGGGSKND